MWITKYTAARTLVWLAAIAMPLQSSPAAACGCTNSDAPACEVGGALTGSAESSVGRCPCTGAEVCRCGESSPCHESSRSCCSKQNAAPSCCQDSCCSKGSSGSCPCGANCQCGKSDAPEAPRTPPTENNNSSERIVADILSVGLFAGIYSPDTTGQHFNISTDAAALAALDRCVVLCRFTI